MAYISNRSGSFEVWLRNLASGSDAAVTRSAKPKVFVTISRDASHVAFWDGSDIYVASTSGGAPRLLCQECGRPDDWLADGKVITHGLLLQGISVREPHTSTVTRIVAHETRHTTGPDLSPDGKWLAFHTAENLASAERRVEGKRQILRCAVHGPIKFYGFTLDRGYGWYSIGPRSEMVARRQSDVFISSRIGTGFDAFGLEIWIQRRNSPLHRSIR